jgi:hypothetical protein
MWRKGHRVPSRCRFRAPVPGAEVERVVAALLLQAVTGMVGQQATGSCLLRACGDFGYDTTITC